MTRIRPETPGDTAAISDLLIRAFDGPAEARLVDQLRRDGDLDLSLVAVEDGRIVGSIVLSPLRAPFPARALAPVAVAPDRQRAGIGTALIAAAFAARPGHTIVVLGDPAYYARSGFRPVGWDCAYAGPFLQAAGPHMPERATIAYAPAFGALG
ncbi:GNAT family N-acetyltransferase [Paracoccus aeridis]|uniref:GNAT family N-acetyltransferase n=1 Tax=Paracoccus aeridis TaxID=1966466 RepID=UPI0010AAE453|nr:N-acetyltransferase [Paracoccus aeridis]